MRQPSIARRLFLHLTLFLLILWLGVVVSVGLVIQHETEEIFDSSLQETAQRLLSLSVREFELQQGPRDSHATEPASHEEYLSYQLFDARGTLLLRSHVAPAAPFAVPLRAGLHTVADQHFFAEVSRDRRYWLVLAERQHHRTSTWQGIVRLLLLPLAILIPLSLLVIHLSVHGVRKSILAFDRELARRDSRDLSPVDESQLPTELLGLGRTANLLMERLKSALEAERSFAANSAHELRTPIATAMAQLDVLRDELPSPDARQRIHQARHTLERLEQMTVKLLQLARAESGIAFNVAPVELCGIVTLLVHDLSFRSSRDIQVSLPEHKVFVMGDIDALGIVIQNLLENADRYACDGAPIEVLVSEQGELTIRNDCEALAEPVLATLSQRFVRGQHRKPGAGIGLSIVRTILQQCEASWQLTSPALAAGRGFAVMVGFRHVPSGSTSGDAVVQP